MNVKVMVAELCFDSSQLGLGDALDRSSPAEVSLGGNYAKEVACGWWHTLALVQSKL